ncbi:heavy metal translocating P-type ATPase [Peptoniphilus sp. oral taxon 386]|uniref:heavy metal translocating P-type ATPase n=1 Tax=Peptoniphilus sp. oral taxon 386 TaxID=652713 RepID=UPI0001DA9B97|nr:heavy metal translocating P-type ATPase [Peptoniphilus sp. oral taxon 386]EFI42154.1 heavy metal translocating P-type ATPase [Peptoniphilus sp. oral taxon 386 str. F0131]
MKFTIEHKIKGRIRFKTPYKFSYEEVNILKYNLEAISGVKEAYIYKRTGSIRIDYEEYAFKDIYYLIRDTKLNQLKKSDVENHAFKPQERIELLDILRDAVVKRTIIKYLMPYQFRIAYSFIGAFPFIKKGIKSLVRRKLDVDVLDATAIGISLLSREYPSVNSIVFLLKLGQRLEEWVFERSKANLKGALSLNVEGVWIKRDEQIEKISLSSIKVGDEVLVEMGNIIPVDGIVIDGIGMVNQSSFTGEAEPVEKFKDSFVFAGTVLEEGRLLIKTTKAQDDTKLNEIIRLISESEENKAQSQKNAERKADSLVKYTFLGSIITYALTRNFAKAKAFLMVDFSCALRLAIPISVMSAMRDASDKKALVKGGKFLEKLAMSDTIVFDKTGTLTNAQPKVVDLITFGEFSKDECLKYAACLEEHFPHSIANAVVRYAEDRNIIHREMHTSPEYIVAHGIASTVDGKRILIGSEHFIFEDEKIEYNHEAIIEIEKLKSNYSLLYLAYSGKLEAVICIEDPIRDEAKTCIEKLRNTGFKNIVMLTGDSENSAFHVADELNLDYYKSQVLPDDKSHYIREQKKLGRTVVMIGDGINDSVALSEADVGISMFKGADIAREVADISINSDSLYILNDMVSLSRAMDRRIKNNYISIVGINSILIILGVFGIITNTTSSLLHNTSTVIGSMFNMRKYKI